MVEIFKKTTNHLIVSSMARIDTSLYKSQQDKVENGNLKQKFHDENNHKIIMQSQDKTANTNIDYTPIVALYEDNNYHRYFIDGNGKVKNYMFGCLFWENGHLYKKESNVVSDLGSYCNDGTDDPLKCGKILIVGQGDENRPFKIYTKDGNQNKASGRFVYHEMLHSNCLSICQVSPGRYAVVNLLDATILQKLDSKYFNSQICYAVSEGYLYSSDYKTLYFVIHNDYGEHIEFFNVETGQTGIVDDVYIDFIREKYGKSRLCLEGADDNFFIFSNGYSYDNVEKNVYDIDGEIRHTFYKQWPSVCDKIIYSVYEGMFNCRSGISSENTTPDFRVDRYLSVTISEKYMRNGRQVTSYLHRLIDYKTENILREGRASLVLSTKDKIKHMVLRSGENMALLDLTNDESIEISLPGYYKEPLYTENDSFINLFAAEYRIDDERFPEGRSYSIVLNSNHKIVFEDVWGSYITVCGMPDGVVYYFKRTGEYGRLIDGGEEIIRHISIPEDSYKIQPVYTENKFLVWSLHSLLLLNCSGVIEARIELDNIKHDSTISFSAEDLPEFKNRIFSFNSYLGFIYEDGKGLVCDFKSGNVSEIRDCIKIYPISMKLWTNLVVYGGSHESYNGPKRSEFMEV